MAPDAATMLDRIGVGPGWRCLDLGCGPRGITDLMNARVGPTGHVVGLDFNAAFIEHARALRLANVDFMTGDAYRTGLDSGSFDLVHMRFLGCTAGQPEALLAEAIRLARAGGIVAMEESDFRTLDCYPPHPAWERLSAALVGAFAAVGSDPRLGQRLYHLMRETGLADVEYRPFLLGVRSGDPLADYLPATVESVRSTIVKHGLDLGGRTRRGAGGMPTAPGGREHRVYHVHRGPGLGARACRRTVQARYSIETFSISKNICVGFSWNPLTFLRMARICSVELIKIHGASSTTIFCAWS